MKKILVGAMLVLGVTSASAWGHREQAALAGLVVGNWVGSSHSAPRYQPSAPVYVAPAPSYNYVQPPAYNMVPQPTYVPRCNMVPQFDPWQNQYTGNMVQVCR